MGQVLLYLAIGLGIGSISGTLGIGGGVLLVPALVWLCGFSQQKAAGTSLAALVMPIALPAAWKYYNYRAVDLEAALCIVPGFAVGGYIGASLVNYIPVLLLRLFFGLMMIFIAVRFIVASDSEAANAAGGLVAMVLAGLTYLGLRFIGRRYAPPSFGEQIRKVQQQRLAEADYQI